MRVGFGHAGEVHTGLISQTVCTTWGREPTGHPPALLVSTIQIGERLVETLAINALVAEHRNRQEETS